MSARAGEIVLNIGEGLANPRLSVLAPFHRYDARPLLARLAGANVELILLDDGSRDAGLLAATIEAAASCACPTKIVVWEKNAGRSAARNRLIAEARGEYVLFLDADMIPDAEDFLGLWLKLIQQKRPFIAFGGLSLAHAHWAPETALHHFLFERSDCRSAWMRERSPAQFVASSNLLVRRDLLSTMPFDSDFSGWGFEDVEWAVRASHHAPILHVDITATHAGLDTVETLLRKSAEAGPNYGRLARKHPEATRAFAAYRIARWLKRLPGRGMLRGLCAWLARESSAPLILRSFALKTFRATHFAEHLP